MRALVNRGPGRFRIEEVPDPRPGPGELLVRPLHAGICITDKHVYEGSGFGDAWSEGLVMGHEFAGVVAEAPAELDGWRVGDRVAVDPRIYCNECLNCRGGYATLCERGGQWLGVGAGRNGGFAELCVVPEYAAFRLPDDVSDELGSITEPAACATRSVRLSGVAPGDNVAILGAEDYGLFALQQIVATAAAVAVVDPSPIRRQAALAQGATVAIDPGATSPTRELRGLFARGADLVLVSMEDYVRAADDYLRIAFSCARVQGTVGVVRAYGADPYARIAPQVPMLKEITVRHFGAFFGNEPIRGGRARGDWQVALEAMASGRIAALPHRLIVDFEDLRSDSDVRDLLQQIPDRTTKVLIRIAGRDGAPPAGATGG